MSDATFAVSLTASEFGLTTAALSELIRAHPETSTAIHATELRARLLNAGTEPVLDRYQNEIGKWADGIFPASTLSSILNHLTEEVLEAQGLDRQRITELVTAISQEASPNEAELSEHLADIFLVSLHGAYKLGTSLLGDADAKMQFNVTRTPSETPEPAGYVRFTDSERSE